MKKLFALSPIVLLAAALLGGCGEQNNTIRVYDANSRLVFAHHGGEGTPQQGFIGLATYRTAKTGTVPYLNVGEFFADFGSVQGKKEIVVSHVGSVYEVKGDNRLFLTIDADKDTIKIDNYEHWSSFSVLNNGVGPDLAAPGLGDESDHLFAVHPSKKSKYIGTLKSENYDLKKYGIDAVAEGNDVYLPAQFLSNVYLRFLGSDMVYNGFDYYMSTSINNSSAPWIHNCFYATKEKFYTMDGEEAKLVPVKSENEAYRFAYKAAKNPDVYRIISLTKDGKGKGYLAGGLYEEGKPESADPTGTVMVNYTWEKKNDALFVTQLLTSEEGSMPLWTQKIPLKEGLFGTKTRPQEIIDLTYNLLRFQFDNFYGLKDVAKFTDFDAYVTSKGLKEGLKAADAATYDDALATLLMKNIDDGHTVYSSPSIYSGNFASKGNELAKNHLGDRYKTLLNNRSKYLKLRADTYQAKTQEEAANLVGLFTHNKTAVIRFDLFANPGSWVSNAIDPLDQVDVATCFQQGNVPLGFDSAFYQIKKNSAIENVVIDLTCNSGGMIMCLPYLFAHFTDDPHYYTKDVARDIVNDYHYSVDLNHDGVYGGEGDTYKGKYKFYILTSEFSFSCANFLPTAAKEWGVKIVGAQSGGGACSVGNYSDGSGSIYNLSSPIVTVYEKNGQYLHTDAGVTVDKAIPSDSWYDLAKLEAAIAGV